MPTTNEYSKVDLRVGTDAQFQEHLTSLPVGAIWGSTDSKVTEDDLSDDLKTKINGGGGGSPTWHNTAPSDTSKVLATKIKYYVPGTASANDGDRCFHGTFSPTIVPYYQEIAPTAIPNFTMSFYTDAYDSETTYYVGTATFGLDPIHGEPAVVFVGLKTTNGGTPDTLFSTASSIGFEWSEYATAEYLYADA